MKDFGGKQIKLAIILIIIKIIIKINYNDNNNKALKAKVYNFIYKT